MQSKHQQEVKTTRLSASDETKYRRKYKDLKKRVRDIEEDNDRLTVKLQRSTKNITRLRVERSFLFEKLEATQQGNLGNPELVEYGHSVKISGDEGSPCRLSLADGHGGKTSEKKPKLNLSGLTPSSSSGRGGRKPKTDPNAPKRPANAFFVYCNIMRQQMKEEHTDATLSDLTKLLAQKWKSMPKEEQKQYYELYEKAKERYATNMTAYNANTPISGSGEQDDFGRQPLGLEGGEFGIDGLEEDEEEEVTMEDDEVPQKAQSSGLAKTENTATVLQPASHHDASMRPPTREHDYGEEEEEEEDVAMGSDDEDV